MAWKILVVDDDQPTLDLMRVILRGQGHDISTAMLGTAALEAVARNKPELVLLDLMMPDMDGLEVCRRLRANPATADLRIVMLTAKAHPADRAEGWRVGADEYITKPVDPVDLVARIKAVMQRPRPEMSSASLLTEMAHAAMLALGAALVWTLAIDEDGRSLRSAAIASIVGEGMTRMFLRALKGGVGEVSFPMARQISPLTDVAIGGNALLEKPLAEVRQLAGGDVLARGLDLVGTRWVSVTPLALRGKVQGVMLVARQGDAPLSTTELRLMEVFAGQLALATENNRLLQRLERQEHEAQREKSFHQTLVNTMGDGLVILDRALRITYVNRRFCRMMGYEDAELMGRPFIEMIHDGDRGPADSWLTRVGGTSSFEKRLMRKNGSVLSALAVHVPTEQTGVGDVIVITDLTDQKSREATLMRRTRQLTAINSAGRTMAASLDIDSIPQTILEETVRVLGARAGSILLVDEKTGGLTFRAVAGPGAEKLVGVQVPVGHGVIGWVAQHGEAALVDDVRRDQRFYRGIDQTTGLTTTNVVAVPLLIKRQVIGVLELVNKLEGKFDADDLAVCETLAQWAAVAIENARLVRDLRAHTRRLEKAYDELKDADKLKDDLIQNVSHELRTPLTFILGYVELLLAGDLGPLSEGHLKALEIVRRKGQSLTKLVNDIMTLQWLQGGGLDKRPVLLNGLLAQTAQVGGIAAQNAGLKVSVDVPDHDVIMDIDEERIGQVLDNLLNNAIKFSPQGGEIVLCLRDLDDEVQIEVQDSGIGIPADKIDMVFDRFYQVDASLTRRFGGMGLGLAICREIMEVHGGKIWATSDAGQGSRFIFSLPKIAAPKPNNG